MTNDALGGDDFQEVPRLRRRAPIRYEDERRQDDRRSWEVRMRTEIPEFHGSLQPKEFLDWLCTTEEVLELKRVPEEMKVPLVATRLQGRATSWWQQFKLIRSWLGKQKVATLEKMKKHIRSTFLPYNYKRLMYQRLQNLR